MAGANGSNGNGSKVVWWLLGLFATLLSIGTVRVLDSQADHERRLTTEELVTKDIVDDISDILDTQDVIKAKLDSILHPPVVRRAGR